MCKIQSRPHARYEDELGVWSFKGKGKGKGKAIPLQALTDPKCFKSVRFPDTKTVGTWRSLGCQSHTTAAFTPRKYSWYSFLLEAQSTPGP
jgi:hypothetical protein